MQLAFCLYKYFPFGGLQRDFLQIAKACQQRGHSVRIYVMKWQGEQPDNMDIVLVPKKGLTNHTRNEYYYHWVQNHLQQHPVDRVVGFNKMPGLDVYFAGDTCFAEKVAKKGFFYKLSKRCRHYLAFEKAVFNSKSHTKLMMLTQQQINNFSHHYKTAADNFYMLPPGIAFDRQYNENSQQQGHQFRQANNIKTDAFVIVQIGSDFKRKGVDRSLYAIAALPQELRQHVNYLVVGQDNPEPYKKLAQQLNIAHNIDFYSGRNDIPDFLFAADLLLHPARQEAAGMVLIEALTAGVPVIVSAISGYAFHIDAAKAGKVLEEPYSQQTLNTELYATITDRQKLSTWHNNALAYSNHTDLYHLSAKAADIILS